MGPKQPIPIPGCFPTILNHNRISIDWIGVKTQLLPVSEYQVKWNKGFVVSASSGGAISTTVSPH